MKKYLIYFLSSLILICLGWWGNNFYISNLEKDTNSILPIKQKPLEKYQIENLSQTYVPEATIEIGEMLVSDTKFNSYLFNFSFDPTLSNKAEKKVTGLINIPQMNKTFPIVVLVRGYVDQKIYQTGTGTKRVGEYLASNGYITVAPDFLGYAGSDIESGNIFESRFQTYTTLLTLLKSINTKNFSKWDGKNIFLWGHSNGGQIVLTFLEITQSTYPTVLWAPVSKPFPYSVLYYTDESEDQGKLIREELSKFELNYDVLKYSLINYLDRIKAPITIFQGTNDDAVPSSWSDSLTKRLKEYDIDVTYLIYPKADHNMNPVWGDVIVETLKVFKPN